MKKILTLLIVGLFLLQGCDNTLPEELLEQEEIEYVDNQLEDEGIIIEYMDDKDKIEEMKFEELDAEKNNEWIQEIPEWFTNDSDTVVESINVSLPDDFQFYISHYFDANRRFNEFENESHKDIDCMEYVYNQKYNGDLDNLLDEKQQYHYVLKKVMLPWVILTWCVSISSIKDYPEFMDLSIECGEDYNGEDKVGYSIVVKAWEHYACVPADGKFNVCSVATPILCRQRESNQVKVKKYYDLNNKCPYGYTLYGAWVDWPTDVCSENVWYCDISTCGYDERNIRNCNMSKYLKCSFDWQWDRDVEVWD